MKMQLIDYYHQDLAEQTTTEGRQYVRRYWFRAVSLTIMESQCVVIEIPKRGTHGTRVERYRAMWETVPLDELMTVFKLLKPYFAQSQHRCDDLS